MRTARRHRFYEELFRRFSGEEATWLESVVGAHGLTGILTLPWGAVPVELLLENLANKFLARYGQADGRRWRWPYFSSSR